MNVLQHRADNGLAIPRQLPLTPTVAFAVGIVHALDVAVKRPHDAYPGKHCRPIGIYDQAQRFHGRLPFWGRVLGLRLACVA
jgi:hypothetical protein